MSFSDILKNAQKITEKQEKQLKTIQPMTSASVMTLSLDETSYDNIVAYSGEELIEDDGIIEDEFIEDENGENDGWTLDLEYRTTESFEVGKQYTDENYSTVDEKKNVHLDPSQINLTQESNSQYVTFIMPRYFDGIDLTNMVISIYFINSAGGEGFSEVINVYYNDTQIKFGWVLSETATALKGKLQFEIHATGVDPLGRKYLLKTRPNSQMEVLESLHGNGQIIYDETWATTFLNQINNYVIKAEKASKQAELYLADVEDIVERAEENLSGYSKGEVDELLSTKAEISVVGELRTDVDNLNDTVVAINNETTGILAKSKTYTNEQVLIATENTNTLRDYVGTIPPWSSASTIVKYVQDELLNYYTKTQVDKLFEDFDITDQLTGIEGRIDDLEEEIENFDGLAALDIEFNEETKTLSFYNGEEKIKDIVLNISSEEDIANALKPIREDLQSIHDNIDNLPTTLESDYYNKTAIDGLLVKKANQSDLDTVSSIANTNKTDIGTIGKTVTDLSDAISKIDTSPNLTYDISYNDAEDPEIGEYGFGFYEIKNEGKENEERTLKRKFVIAGGSGSGSSSTLKISYVTTSPVIATVNDKILIKYNFSGTDSSGDIITEGNYTWKIGSKIIASGIATNGENTFDITDFATTTSQKFTLSITDDSGSLATKSWTVQKVDVRLESTFRDSDAYNGDVSFNYTPYGAIEKEIHFILDGEELGTVKTSVSGIPTSYPIPAQSHGAHLLEVYMTAEINGKTVGLEEIIDEDSGEVIGYNHTIKIVKDILWCDPTSEIPIIGCATPTINVMQYNTVNIKYAVIDPNTETPKVTWYIGEEVASEETLTEKDKDGYYTFSYKANDYGTFVLKAICGESEPKVITINVEKLSIDVAPVTGGLEFDFNPVGYSNSSANRLWSYKDVTMTVSNNFDWVNGGYQIDENGDQYFCVKAGTNAIINYNLFADDPKKNGKEFKLIFRTKNIRKRDTSFLTCMDDGIGLDMKVENAILYNSGGLLKSDYCEDTIIEYEFNINKYTDMMIVMTYEDGTPSKPYEYTETSSFKHTSAQPITIGSADCDIHIYRMKAYSTSLTDTDIKNNFIADARNATEMIARYNRNQIYTDGNLITTSASGDFNVDALMKAAPDLRYIFLEVPQFTNDKDNKIDGCTVYFRYPNGKRPEDNWTCTGMRHRGQGTSSNLYGYAGRNIDLCMDRKTSLFTWTDEEGKEVTSSTITLTDTSYPTDYLNVKVNIASSENANNAGMAQRFNEYQPFLRYARKKDSRVKDTMEFYNCVVFIRETSTDTATTPHREFNDNNWHFYAIGNVGDSKKTDDTRVNNANDPKEHVVEISDADKPLCGFQTGKENNAICTVEEWTAGNTAYDILHSTEYVYDEEGAFESFGGETFEFRYEMDGITDEQREENINTWRDLYRFIVTSTDEEFYAHLKDYFVVDSAVYFYLFTERYTMVDNRAKNSFWHYGKVYISKEEAAVLGDTEASYYIIDDAAAAINDGYRYDLTFGYDFDTCLGIDNTGDYVFSYGKEDTDYYVDGDPSSDYVFRVADSVFFCRLRDLFHAEMQAMFKDREEKNAWNSNSLITQWDNSQALFPEELWRLDYERKYYRTYLGLSIDNSINEGEGRGIDKTFLIGKFFGRKKYARRAFEINQEIYFATKYFGRKALNDVFFIRGNVPIGSSIKPNYSLTLVPYSDMYVCVQYTSTGTPIHIKAKAGETVYFENNAERMDFVYIYAASYIQEVGDLSRCYIGDNNFTAATRLQKLVIGSTDPGYENIFMKNVLVANNPLLEYLDLRNISGINEVINVSGCSNLKELYAEGTNATGVIFANGGLLETAHLPSITSLSMKNLNYIKDFSVDSYAKLQTLIVENTPAINTYNIVKNAPLLKTLRLVGMNWDSTYNITDASIFDRLLTIGGIDSSGVYETDLSVLTGNAYVSIMKEKQYADYQEAWNDLHFDWSTWVEQFPVTFLNADGAVLEVQYIDKGEDAIDPTTRVENQLIPTLPSTISHDFTFSKWDKPLIDIFGERTITAIYDESLRKYKIKYVSKGITMPGYPKEGYYGDNIVYSGDVPTYTNEESGYKYYLFDRWDKSGFLTGDFDENGVKTVNAIYDSFEYKDGAFSGKQLSNMSPVEIYAMNKLGLYRSILTNNDYYSFSIGHDFDYDDIDSVEVISSKKVFDGTNYYDSKIKLFEEDRDFVLAIDYKFTDSTTNSVLAQCFQGNGSVGFQLQYNKGVQLKWGSATSNVASVNEREMVVIRHKKGDTNLYVYSSNLSGDSIATVSLSSKEFNVASTLVFGCDKRNETVFENYAKGEVNWVKLWYADLGDSVCRQLASWTHETMGFKVSGFNRYYLAGNSDDMCSFSLLATNLLDRIKKWNNSSTNVGGWAASALNKYLNNRLYAAMPSQIKSLLKKVKIASSIGGKSSEISFSDCYIAIPAIAEVDASITSEPYASEGRIISYFTTPTTRKRSFVDGDYSEYWLRSPNVGYSGYVYRIDADGVPQPITGANTDLGVLILISF